MILTCASCSSRYTASEEAIGAGRMVRCAACGYEWLAQPSLVLDTAADAAGGEGSSMVAAPMALTRDLVEKLRPKQKVSAQLSPAALIRARQAARERRLRLLRLGAAWGGAALVLLGVLGVGAAFRDRLAERWPKLASLYESVGLEVNATGIAIEGLTVEAAAGPTPDVALVRGVLRNMRGGPKQAPPVRLALLDARGQELAVAVAYPLQTEIKSAGLTTFEARFERPPGEAVMLAARFAPVGSVEAAPTPDSGLEAEEAEALQRLLEQGPPEPSLPAVAP